MLNLDVLHNNADHVNNMTLNVKSRRSSQQRWSREQYDFEC